MAETEYTKFTYTRLYSHKPRTGEIYCLAPDCDRSWVLSGSKSGFIGAAAKSHSFAHWRRFHDANKHGGKFLAICPECIVESRKQIELFEKKRGI